MFKTQSRPPFTHRGFRPGLLPLLCRPIPRGDGGVPDDKDKENKNLTALLAKNNGDAMALASQLLSENADLRAERRTWRTEKTTLEGKALKDGQVAVSADDAKALDAYKPLGTPDELKVIKTEHGTFKTDKERLEGENTALKANEAKTKRENDLRDVADVEGYKFSVLADRDSATPGLTYEIKDVEVDGKKVKKAFVKFKNGEGDNAPIEEKALSEFATQKWADYLPALQATDTQNTDASKRHVSQGGGGGNNNGGGSGSIYERARKEAEERNKTPQAQGPSLEDRLHLRTNATA
jgi:hypothetical protein